jgi:selenocysteine lyase/cysteine desulfurase
VPGEFECIRVTPNIYSSLEDVDRFARAITAIARA